MHSVNIMRAGNQGRAIDMWATSHYYASERAYFDSGSVRDNFETTHVQNKNIRYFYYCKVCQVNLDYGNNNYYAYTRSNIFMSKE